MATKSSNTIGNPWHDEKGQFTSETSGNNFDNFDSISNNLETNDDFFDVDDVDSFLNSFLFDVDEETLPVFENSKEASEYLGSLLNKSPEVFDLGKDKDFINASVECITNVYKKFPKCFDNLEVFGNTKKSFQRARNILYDKFYGMVEKDKPYLSANSIIYITEKIVKKNLRFGSGVGAKTWRDSKAILFNKNGMEHIRQCDFSKDIHKHLRSVPPEKWAIYHEIGHLISNFVESRKKYDKMLIFRQESILYHSEEITKYGKSYGSTGKGELKYEFFSECFADYMCFGENARNVSKQAVSLMEKLYEESSK